MRVQKKFKSRIVRRMPQAALHVTAQEVREPTAKYGARGKRKPTA